MGDIEKKLRLRRYNFQQVEGDAIYLDLLHISFLVNPEIKSQTVKQV